MLTPQELAEILNYVNQYHSWEHMMTNVEEGRKIIKYVDVTMDTRDGKIWVTRIQFRQICNSNLQTDQKYDQIIFTEENCTKEKIMNWLQCNPQ